MRLPDSPVLLNSALIVAAIGLLGLIVRLVGPWRKQISDLEERLRRELAANNARCEAELRIVRHRDRGSRQMIYALLHIFDMPEEARAKALAGIRSELAAMEQAEATETAILLSGEFPTDPGTAGA